MTTIDAGVEGSSASTASARSLGARRVLLAEPRGFCAGVEMAIKALAWMVERFEPPVFCYHDIVHNDLVVELFEAAGVVFVDDVDEVVPGAPLMLSAHGTAPAVVAAAEARAGVVVDAACPLVTKVHHEVRTRAAHGDTVVYVGHAGHDEAIGTMAVAPEAVRLVESVDDVAALARPDGPVALLSQTTLAVEEWADVRSAVLDRFGEVWGPVRSDLCFATTNRQAALRALVPRVDAVVIIGSPTSSNTNALERLAHEAADGRGDEAAPLRVVRIDAADDLPVDLLDGRSVVGVTAGASVPEGVVQSVLDRLAPIDGVEAVRAVDEDEYFPLPRQLRALLPREAVVADRSIGAGEVLDRLADRVAAGGPIGGSVGGAAAGPVGASVGGVAEEVAR